MKILRKVEDVIEIEVESYAEKEVDRIFKTSIDELGEYYRYSLGCELQSVEVINMRQKEYNNGKVNLEIEVVMHCHLTEITKGLLKDFLGI